MNNEQQTKSGERKIRNLSLKEREFCGGLKEGYVDGYQVSGNSIG